MTTETYVQAIGLKPERAEEYLRHHAEPWPEVTASLRAAGLHDYTIYYLPEAGLLVQRSASRPTTPPLRCATSRSSPRCSPGSG
jgi:hypothetical protein